MNIVKVKLKNTSTNELKYGTDGAACFDIPAAGDIEWVREDKLHTAIIPTGLFFEIPEGYKINIFPRSGWGFKYNIQLANGTGIIDSDYRGEVKVKLIAHSCPLSLPEIKYGTRVAQAEIVPVYIAEFETVDELSDTERGIGGFGSTGV